MNLLSHDDFSWLVYADWLEERGNPLSDYIRFQVEEDFDTWNYEYCLGCYVGGSGSVGGGSGGINVGVWHEVIGSLGFGSIGGSIIRGGGVGGNQ